MTTQLDLADIQGYVLRVYGRSYPLSRHVFLNIRDTWPASSKAVSVCDVRAFVGDITRHVTTAVEWGNGPNQIPRPDYTLNIAFTYQGLKEVGLPRASLNTFPAEFTSGMKQRRDILGDDGPSYPDKWDPIWKENRETRDRGVHIFISISARDEKMLEERYNWLKDQVERYHECVKILDGHRGENDELLDYQDTRPVMENGRYTAKEHFGYTDGIGDPVFEGSPKNQMNVQGRGKQMADGSWQPLATGEFLLGHIDEAREYPPAPSPVLLSRNGTYMAYRKLHQNVATFETYLEEHSRKYPGGKELLAAKFVGRWRDNGAPLVKAPDTESKILFDSQLAAARQRGDHDTCDRMLSHFTYDDDMSGAKCPFSAHIRRINPRASLQMCKGEKPGSMVSNKGAFDTPGSLADRRRILRRGSTYGEVKDRTSDKGNHGVIIMAINADIARQFEFVQQQWINYGNDFQAASDKEILLGNHNASDDRFSSKAVLQVEPDSDEAPYFLTKIPRFVETRGGDYFFVPSMTALQMIAQGVIDPT